LKWEAVFLKIEMERSFQKVNFRSEAVFLKSGSGALKKRWKWSCLNVAVSFKSITADTLPRHSQRT